MHNFSVNVPSLLLLAWLSADQKQRDDLLQLQQAEEWRRHNGKQLITVAIEQELARVDADQRGAPLFLHLLRHQVARMDLDCVEWALCGKQGVYLAQDAVPYTADAARDAFAAKSVTQVVQEALAAQSPLRSYLQAVLWGGIEPEKAGIILQQWFLREAHALCAVFPSFLMPQLLQVSLQQIAWEKLATWLPNREDS